MRLETLKARIGRSEYRVDPDAVAEAIVRRWMATPSALKGALGLPNGRRPGQVSSGDVLEAG